MSNIKDICFYNSKNLCEPDCPHLKISPFGKSAKCLYYDEELERADKYSGDVRVIGHSPWVICEECEEDCYGR